MAVRRRRGNNKAATCRLVAFEAGFTTIELIAVIIIVGILAGLTLPHFLGRDAFDARGVHDSLVSALRYAQKKAIASNCPVQVQIQSGGYSLMQRPQPCDSGAFTDPVIDPVGDVPFASNNLHGVTLSPSRSPITFSPTGAADGDATIAITGAPAVQIVGTTGYVETQ
ncbi:MAG TPA: GspH/FimT family pseudopilin [Gammaproteobacteria bacterium]|nr:GspH/FimT family pseudopilin [Gammaproteobacteria bacterium]